MGMEKGIATLSHWIGSFSFGIKGLIRKLIITVSTG